MMMSSEEILEVYENGPEAVVADVWSALQSVFSGEARIPDYKPE